MNVTLLIDHPLLIFGYERPPLVVDVIVLNLISNLLIQKTMKTTVEMQVQFLLVYPNSKEVISKVNKVKGIRDGALVLVNDLVGSDGQTPTKSLELSGKQISRLAAMHGITEAGRKGWNALAMIMDVKKSVATITCEEHKKGEHYVADGVDHEYTETSTKFTVDSISINSYAKKKLVDRLVDNILDSWENADQNDDNEDPTLG